MSHFKFVGENVSNVSPWRAAIPFCLLKLQMALHMSVHTLRIVIDVSIDVVTCVYKLYVCIALTDLAVKGY